MNDPDTEALVRERFPWLVGHRLSVAVLDDYPDLRYVTILDEAGGPLVGGPSYVVRPHSREVVPVSASQPPRSNIELVAAVHDSNEETEATPEESGLRPLSDLGALLRDAAAAILGGAEGLVLNATLTPLTVRGVADPAEETASELSLAPDVRAALGAQSQARATLADEELQVWLVGLTNLKAGQVLQVIALTPTGDVITGTSVVEGPLRAQTRLKWSEAAFPAEIAIVLPQD